MILFLGLCKPICCRQAAAGLGGQNRRDKGKQNRKQRDRVRGFRVRLEPMNGEGSGREQQSKIEFCFENREMRFGKWTIPRAYSLPTSPTLG